MGDSTQDKFIHDCLFARRSYECHAHKPNHNQQHSETQLGKCSHLNTPRTTHRYCLNFSFPGGRYLFFRRNLAREYNDIKASPISRMYLGPNLFLSYTDKTKRTWLEAEQLCRLEAAFLPVIRSRVELMEIISVMRLSTQIPQVEALFIGLHLHLVRCVFPDTECPLICTIFSSASVKVFWSPILKQCLCGFQGFCGWTNQDPVTFQLWENVLFHRRIQVMYSISVHFKFLSFGGWPDTSVVSSELQDLAQSAESPNHAHSCTAMLLINLAQPEWITVNCHEPLLGDALCRTEADLLFQNLSIRKVKDQHCERNCILFHSQCVLFLYGNLFGKFMTKQIHTSSFSFLITDFLFVFKSVLMSVTPIFSPTTDFYHTYSRYSNIFQFQEKKVTDKSMKGYHLLQTAPLQILNHSGNIYHCDKQFFISVLFICERNSHCSDESFTSICKYVHENLTQSNVPVLLNRHANGRLHLFGEIAWNSDGKQHQSRNNVFRDTEQNEQCQKVTTALSPNHRKDLMTVNTGKSAKCSDVGFIQCRVLSSHWFQVSDVCIYKLSQRHALYPCPMGEHLQDCAEFQCNINFKCSDFYCIPWSYVCDSRWDCPKGHDEFSVVCSANETCRNMLKCQQTSICIHPANICDGEEDCALKDDEGMCSLHTTICPKICSCLTYALSCKKVGPFASFRENVRAYYVVAAEHCSETFVQGLLQRIDKPLLLFLAQNNLVSICGGLPCRTHTLLIDLGYNKLEVVSPGCFQNASQLLVLKLNNNKIYKIARNELPTLESLLYMNVSHNNLLILDLSSTSLVVVSLKNNSDILILKSSLIHSKIKILISDAFHVCCGKPENSVCSAKGLWYQTCTNLIPNQTLSVLYHTGCFTVIILELISALSHTVIYRKKSEKMSKPFSLIALAIGLTDLSFGMNMLLTVILNYIYGSDITSLSTK